MRLLLPLKYYDEAGRIKPSNALLICLWYMCRTYLVFVATFSYRQDSAGLLAFFYPHKSYFYGGLIIAVPALMVVLLVSFREKLFNTSFVILFKLIKPLMLMGLLLDVIFHVLVAQQQKWQFSWVVAISVLLDVLCMYYVARDKHLRMMTKDWAKGSY